MLVVGYCMGIASERRLCEEDISISRVPLVSRLGLDGKVPGPFDLFQEQAWTLSREQRPAPKPSSSAMAEGLVGADGFAFDANLIAADANIAALSPERRMEARGDRGRIAISRRARVSRDAG